MSRLKFNLIYYMLCDSRIEGKDLASRILLSPYWFLLLSVLLLIHCLLVLPLFVGGVVFCPYFDAQC